MSSKSSKPRSARAARAPSGGPIDSRTLRAHRRSQDWKSFRSEGANKRRGVTDDLSPVKEHDKLPKTQEQVKVDVRRDMLKKWKEEKELKRKLETSKTKKFKVTHLVQGEYDRVKPIRKVPDAPKPSNVCAAVKPVKAPAVGRRVTRASVAPPPASRPKPGPKKQKVTVPAPSARARRARNRAETLEKTQLPESKVTTRAESTSDIILGHSTGNFTFSAPSQLAPLSPTHVEKFFSGATFFSPITETEARRCSTPKPNSAKSEAVSKGTADGAEHPMTEPAPSSVGSADETVPQKMEETISSVKPSTSNDLWNKSAPDALEPIEEQGTFRTPRSVSRAARRRTVSMVLAQTGSNKKTPKELRKSFIMRHLSPEEGVEVLKHSPMIEMNRRAPKSGQSPTAADVLPPLPSFDDIDDVFQPGSTTSVSSFHGDLKNVSFSDEPQPQGTQSPKSAVPETADSVFPESAPAKPDSECAKETSEVKQTDVTDKKEEEEHDVPYFRNLIQSHTDRLNVLCKKWEDTSDREDTSDSNVIPEEAEGEIRTTTGKAQLLIRQRFKQFSGLIDDCEFKTGEKETTCQDLQGFWDMVYCQVEDIDAKFQGLDKLQANNWVSDQPKVVKKKILKKKPAAKSAAKTGGPSVRSRFAAFRAQMKQPEQQNSTLPAEEAVKTFEGGFFRVNSPVRSPKPHCEGGTPSQVQTVSFSFSRSATPSGASPCFKAATTSRSVGLSPLVMDSSMGTSTEKVTQISTSQDGSTVTRRSLAIDSSSMETTSKDGPVEKSLTANSGASIFTPEHSGPRRQSIRTSSLSCDSRCVQAEMEPSSTNSPGQDVFSKYLLPSDGDNLPAEGPTEMFLDSPLVKSPLVAHSPHVEDVDMASHSKRGLAAEFNEHSASAKKRRQHLSAPTRSTSAVTPRQRRSISASEQRHSLHRSAISNRTRNRHSVHFSVEEMEAQDSISLRMPSTPFNRDSLVPHSRILETEAGTEQDQKENCSLLNSDTPTTGLAKLSMNQSLMRQTRRSSTLALQTDEDGDLMSFSPLTMTVNQAAASEESTPPRWTRRQSRLSLL